MTAKGKVPHTKDDPKQSDAFIKKAQELEADGEQSEADRLLGTLARMKPEPHPKKASK